MQAKTGGELGLNNEWYKGGQFLPSSETTIKGMQTSIYAKPRKQGSGSLPLVSLRETGDLVFNLQPGKVRG